MTDRELAALVAEKVMGWKRHPDNAECWLHASGISTAVERTPAYSTDISAAFLVVEEMRKRGWDVFTTTRDDANTDAPWFADFRKTDVTCSTCARRMTTHEGMESADSAPRAICLAALRALGVEVPA